MSFAAERKQSLVEAHRARNAGRTRRAIALYKRVLREEPRNVDVALRVAPLLARRGEVFEAWQLYRGAARQLARKKAYPDCVAVYRDACLHVPREFDAWRMRAELEIKLGRDPAAFETLLEGRTHFGDIRTRAQAIALLVRARSIEPWDPDVTIDLARLYARSDQTDAALDLLAAQASRCDPRTARRVRSLQWRITLSPRFAWLWMQCWWDRWLGGRRNAVADANDGEPVRAEAADPLTR